MKKESQKMRFFLFAQKEGAFFMQKREKIKFKKIQKTC